MKNILFFILLFCASFGLSAQRGNNGGQQSNVLQVFPNCVVNVLPRNNAAALRNTLCYTCSDSSVYYIDSKGVSIKMGRANGSGLAFVTTDNVTTEGDGTPSYPLAVKEIPLSLITQSFAQNGMVPVWDSILGIWNAKHISFVPDKDFLRVLNNGLPGSVTDTLYTKGLKTFGARQIWPKNPLAVIDSTDILGANFGVMGERNARAGFKRYLDGRFSSVGQEGSNVSVRMGPTTDGFAVEKYTGGTDHTNGTGVKRIAYFNGLDSTVTFTGYANVNDAGNSPLIATFGSDGKMRSDLITEFKPLLKDTQSLSLSGSVLSLSGGGGSVSLPGGGGSAVGVSNSIGAGVSTNISTYGFAQCYTSGGVFNLGNTSLASNLHGFYLTAYSSGFATIKGSGEVVVTASFAFTEGQTYYVTDTGTLSTSTDADFDSAVCYVVKSLGSNQYILNLLSPKHFAN